ncbi:MAG TPA: bifunctional histidinol-phosphatase/imidazoleglycerol-phosphate dehydratase HisB [Salinimicrobium sp.]|nr:bifunctional histidinol-phosphatase/imidazoleglycerol-phosphate dehydratase HisB [Salinimicrobium sp.]
MALEPRDEQLDHFDKLEFFPGAIQNMAKIAAELEFELVMVTNQDGLGTASFPEDSFWPVQHFIENILKNEGVEFSNVVIDRTFPKDNAETRKPRTGLLLDYLDSSIYDLKNSFVIGDRMTDMELAKNLGCKGILLNSGKILGENEIFSKREEIKKSIALETGNWQEVYSFLKGKHRIAEIKRTTRETDIYIAVNLDGSGESEINTGIAFFDHMLEQISRHGHIDLKIMVRGDLEVDEHHTIEDTAIALGEAFQMALGNKLGIERYGFLLPMDESLAQVCIDFGGRNHLVWQAEFHREMIGKMPTEMFEHFFKSFSDAARANINIKAEGKNEHHKIESIFKAFARAIRAAVRKDPEKLILPSTKGML